MLLPHSVAIDGPNTSPTVATSTATIGNLSTRRQVSRRACLCFRAESASDAAKWVASLTTAVDKVLAIAHNNKITTPSGECDSLFRHLVQHRGPVDYMGKCKVKSLRQLCVLCEYVLM